MSSRGAKITSALASCFIYSKDEMESGTRLEILRKLKKEVRKAALNMIPICILSHWVTSLVSIRMSMMDLILGLN